MTFVAVGIALCGCDKEDSRAFDLSNPRGAAVTFARALETGDVKRAKAACLASGRELDLVEAMTFAASNLQTLFVAARKKYGEAATKELNERAGMRASQLLEAGQVILDGERATVMPKSATNSVPLKRIRGLWKVDIGALIKGQDMSNAIPRLRALGGAAKAVSADIETGKYATLDEVKAAMGNNILASLGEVPTAGATTAPATETALDPRELSPAAKKPAVVPDDDAQ